MPILSVYFQFDGVTRDKKIILVNYRLFTIEFFYFFRKKLTSFGRSYTSPFAIIKMNKERSKRKFASMLTVLEIQTTLVSLWKLQKTYHKNNNIKCIEKYHCPPPFEKKLWLLTLNEIFKGKKYYCLYFDIL